MAETTEGDRIIVTGSSSSCFFPRLEKEVNYIREFDGRASTGPFLIRGSVYGREIQFRGSGDCFGVVVGRGDLLLDASRPGERQRMLGPITANGAVTMNSPPVALQETCIAEVKAASFIVRGDVVGDHVSLSNAVVLGNVHGTNVRLTNCIVFGAAVASEQVSVQASTILYYNCRHIAFEGPCMMLHAMGESAAPPVFAPFEDARGQIFPCDVRYYPATRTNESKSLGNRNWERPAGTRGSLLVPHADWITVNTETDRVGAGGQPTRSKRTVLTIAGRALNLAALQVATSQLTGMLKICFEFDHYSPRAQREALESIRASATEEELWVFSTVLQPLED
jgi:hypothetical protein